MKKIWIVLLLVTSLFSKPLDTYTINLEQIDAIHNVGDKIILELKDKYWENFFEFTRKNLSKKVMIKLDTISITPSIFSPIYSSIELSPVNPEKFSKKLKLLLSKSKTKTKDILEKKRNIFLNKMMKKHTTDDYIRAELITLYHSRNNTQASKKCIEVYENTTDEMKSKLLIDNYNNLFDCYLDLNNTLDALKFLSVVKKEIEENELYLVLEKEAYVYVLLHQPKKARKIYEKALIMLKKSNFIKRVLNPDERIIKEVAALKESEIKRLETSILDLEH